MHCILFTDINGSLGVGKYAGAYRLATELRNNGNKVTVIDYMMAYTVKELKDIIKKHKRKNTEWVGFSSTFLAPRNFDVFLNRFQTTNKIKETTCIGLTKVEADDLFDYIKSLGLKIYIGGSKVKNEFSNVENIYGEGEIKFNKNFDFTQSKINWTNEDNIFEGEHLPIEIARGCIFKCKFCSYNLNGKKLWEFCKSPEVVKEELMENWIKFGTTGYMFCDDTYNDSPEKVSSFNDMIKKLPFEIEFSSYARLDLILSKPKTLPQLIESGMKSVFFGIESFNHQSGKFVGKGMHPDKTKQGLLDIKRQFPELQISLGFIAGLPYETKETLKDSVKWLKNSPIDNWSMQILSLGKKSILGSNPSKFGYTLDENGKWYTDNLTYDEALNIVDTPITNISGFTFYNRLRNLGYTPEQTSKLTINDRKEIELRTKNVIERYKEKII